MLLATPPHTLSKKNEPFCKFTSSNFLFSRGVKVSNLERTDGLDSQSEHRIRFIVPTGTASDMIKDNSGNELYFSTGIMNWNHSEISFGWLDWIALSPFINKEIMKLQLKVWLLELIFAHTYTNLTCIFNFEQTIHALVPFNENGKCFLSSWIVFCSLQV